MSKKGKRLITAEDLLKMQWIRSFSISPGEDRIAYALEWIDSNRKKYWSNIWMITTSGEKPRQFTTGNVKDRTPVWSPDGQYIAFFSVRDEKDGIYIIPADGGEARQVVTMDGVFASLSWSPDGKRLLCAFRKNDPPADGEKQDEKEKKKAAPVFRHITRLFYRYDGDGFRPADGFHLWTFDVANGKGQQLTSGKFDELAPAWSPDGKKIVFASNRQLEPDRELLKQELFWIAVDGGKVHKIPKPLGPIEAISWSPDGKKIAWCGHANPADAWGVTNYHIWVADADGKGSAVDLIQDFDRMAMDITICDMGEGFTAPPPIWSKDSKTIFFLASNNGSTHIFSVPAKGGRVRRLIGGERHIQNFGADGSRSVLVFVSANSTSVGDLWLGRLKGGKIKQLRQLTGVNQPLFDQIRLSRPEKADFHSFDGTMIAAWVLKPPNFKARRKYPAIVEIHGGPRTQYGNTFFHEFQLLAAKGYVVFYSNPRGSQGYGEEFAGAIVKDWGNLDYKDIMAGVDYLITKPYVESKRLGVTGGSYGGYMTNWIVGHTNRFKAAVTQRSVVNLVSFLGSSDFGYDDHREFGGQPWNNFEEYVRMSPITYVEKIRTPLLILHNEQDLRCSIEQAEQLFTALKVLKRKVEFVRFPEEPHGLSRHGRPDRRLARLEWILKWFDRYL